MQRPEGVFTPCNKGLLQARADDFSGGRLFYEPASADPAHSVNRFPSASSRVTGLPAPSRKPCLPRDWPLDERSTETDDKAHVRAWRDRGYGSDLPRERFSPLAQM
jgi:hypothetical protein